MEEFIEIKEIGSGSYGVVSLVELHGSLYAIKQVNKETIQKVDKVANVLFERDVLQAANSLSIPEFNFTFQVSITELFGTISKLVESNDYGISEVFWLLKSSLSFPEHIQVIMKSGPNRWL